jgi:hypothetical protein
MANSTIKKIAYVISRIFDSLYWLFILSVMVILSPYFDGFNRVIFSTGAIIIAGIVPWVIYWQMRQRGLISDIDFSNKLQRTQFLMANAPFWSLAFLATFFIPTPQIIFILTVSLLTIGAIVIVITRFWKISIHALLVTIVGIITVTLYGWVWWPVFLLVPIVWWSRLVLRQHDIFQLLAGSGVGVILYFILNYAGY